MVYAADSGGQRDGRGAAESAEQGKGARPAGGSRELSVSHGAEKSHYIQTQRIIEVLAEQGWTKWDHFVVRWTQKNSQSTSFYGVLYILDQIPVSPQEKAAELRELDRLVQGKTLTIQRGRWPAAEVQKYLNRWEQQSVERGEEQHG